MAEGDDADRDSFGEGAGIVLPWALLPRMSGKHGKADRLVRICRWLIGGRRLTTRDVADELGVDIRSAQRDFNDLLATDLHIAIDEDVGGRRVYYIPREHQRLSVELGEGEVVALHVALDILERFERSVLFESLESLRNRLLTWLDGSRAQAARAAGPQWRGQKFFALPFLPYRYVAAQEIFDAVVSALLRERKLRFDYRAASGRRARHVVQPLTLLFYKGAFYLLALGDTAPPNGSPTVYALARMRDPEVLRRQRFTYPRDFDPLSVLNQTTGMMPGDPADVEIHFDPTFQHYLAEERRWPPGTEIAGAGDHVRFTARLTVNDELARWLLGFGGAAEVIRPAALREAVRTLAAQVLGRYGEG